MIGAENRDLNPFRRKRKRETSFRDLIRFEPLKGLFKKGGAY